jgi:anti-anti-sigma regulatory factor
MESNVIGTKIRDSLVIALPADLAGGRLDEVRGVTLNHVGSSHPKSVIFECSGLRYLDTEEFEGLRQLSESVVMLGARTCLIGLSAGIVKYLALSDVNLDGIKAFLGLDEALDYFSRVSEDHV